MLQFSMFDAVKRLELMKGKSIPVTTLAFLIGVDTRTVKAFMAGDAMRVDFPTVDKVIAFFAREGMPVGVEDLFTIAGV